MKTAIKAGLVVASLFTGIALGRDLGAKLITMLPSNVAPSNTTNGTF